MVLLSTGEVIHRGMSKSAKNNSVERQMSNKKDLQIQLLLTIDLWTKVYILTIQKKHLQYIKTNLKLVEEDHKKIILKLLSTTAVSFLLIIYFPLKVKQSRYRPGVAQGVPGS